MSTLREQFDRYRGDPASDDGVWERIYNTALSIAQTEFHFDLAEAEEIGQEMALRVFRHAKSEGINFSWLRAGARFLCIDRRRARDAHERAVARYGADLESARGVTARVNDAARALAPAIALLPHRCRHLIENYFYIGMTWSEIDAALQRGRRCSQYEMKKCLAILRANVGVMRS